MYIYIYVLVYVYVQTYTHIYIYMLTILKHNSVANPGIKQHLYDQKWMV